MNNERPQAEHHEWVEGSKTFEVSLLEGAGSVDLRPDGYKIARHVTEAELIREILRLAAERDLELAHRLATERQLDELRERLRRFEMYVDQAPTYHDMEDVAQGLDSLLVPAVDGWIIKTISCMRHVLNELWYLRRKAPAGGGVTCRPLTPHSPQSDRRHYPDETQQPDDQQQHHHHPDDELDGLRHRDEALDQVETQAKDHEDDQDRENGDVHGSPPKEIVVVVGGWRQGESVYPSYSGCRHGAGNCGPPGLVPRRPVLGFLPAKGETHEEAPQAVGPRPRDHPGPLDRVHRHVLRRHRLHHRSLGGHEVLLE